MSDNGEIGTSPFERTDLEQLERSGISRQEAERQLALLKDPPRPRPLVRACRLADGVEQLGAETRADLAAKGRAAAAAGRVTKFVPASGAASRMFQALVGGLESGGPEPVELLANLGRFAFENDLRAAMRSAGVDLDDALRRNEAATVVRFLLDEEGLGYRSRPKGLLKFHTYENGSRTAFEEQLIESIPYVRDADGLCRIHFTVSESHLDLFSAVLEELRRPLLERFEVHFDVTFSMQSPATDTLAIDPRGRPFRVDGGELLLRPGGHGALLDNLSQLEGDIVLVKNIDNILPESAHPQIASWKQILTGRLISLQERVFELLDALEAEPPSRTTLEAGFDLVAAELDLARPAHLADAPADEQRRWLIDRLDRPIRACGVVRNEGEPGGGPFWVTGHDGVATPQIVERSQVDPDDAAQLAIFDGGTHFNPVDLACAVRDRRGELFDLDRFVDPSAVFIAGKSWNGRELQALERPGLWNGAMAHWTTLFVEVPASTFAPVKTVFDLLRPAHQPSAS